MKNIFLRIFILLLFTVTGFSKAEIIRAGEYAENVTPVITGSVTISGTLKVGNTLTAKYTYSPDNYPESGSTFRWYLADNAAGDNAVLISSSGSTFVLLANHEPKYIRVEVTPRDNKGTTGANYSSAWYGPIQKADQQANQPPIVTNVRIRGNPVYCGVLTGLYEYSDAELDPEQGSTFRWLRASTTSETPVPISGATSNTYTVSTNDQGKYIYFEVTPKASSGSTTGTAVVSTPTSLIQGTLPSVTFTGNATICAGTSTNISLTFTGTPPFTLDYSNGTTSNTISSSSYNYELPVSEGGTYKGTKLTDILNCPVTNLPSSAVITLKDKPQLDFLVENTCFTGDSSIFKNNSSAKTSIKAWAWNFGDNTSAAQNTSVKEAPRHKYPAAGSYTVTLAAENTQGCKVTITKTIQLGEKPVANLTWDKECFSTSVTTKFQNNSVSANKISKYKWTLSDATKVIKEDSGNEFNQTIAAAGTYNVKLVVTTEFQCTDSITKTFATKPVIRLLDSMYSDNAETKRWNMDLKSNNNWVWGKPDGTTINSTHSGNNAYFTRFAETHRNQQLELSSPCFDFTNIQKPFVDVWVNYATTQSKEGVTLQYKQDGETTWKNVGDLNSGTNWYNNNNISGKPGNQLVGWSGNSSGWKQARQNLDELINKKNIVFRMVYASTADAGASEGFAFDDIFIGQRGKKVLVEHFTNLSDPLSNQSNQSVDSVLAASGVTAIGIQYHTSFPGSDSLNAHNTANPAARALYYGIAKVPVSYVDGGVNSSYIYDYASKKLNITDINNRSFEDPRFDLSITAGIENNNLTGNVKVKAENNVTGDNILLIAIVEDIETAGKTFRNVLKFMYPSAAGTKLPGTMTKDQIFDQAFTWPIAHVFNTKKLKVVAFVQNNTTKEVYQVEMTTNTTAAKTGIELNSFRLYPNPAKDWISIEFETALEQTSQLKIYNIEGRLVKEINLQKGVTEATIQVSELLKGMYYLQISNSLGNMITSKLLVQ